MLDALNYVELGMVLFTSSIVPTNLLAPSTELPIGLVRKRIYL